MRKGKDCTCINGCHDECVEKMLDEARRNGYKSAIAQIASYISILAGGHFRSGKDDLAEYCRDLSRDIDKKFQQ